MINARNIEDMKVVIHLRSILVSKLLSFTFPTLLINFKISKISFTCFSDIY
jgi:hypothetical protein